MCGITGIFHYDGSRPADEGIVRKMTATLTHRGPDGEGYYIKENLGLGHRRLTIIDLETGDQPLFNEDKSITIIYNGEIYNYIELREELKKTGCVFKTNSDTEVILRAYEKWGTDCQNKLNGMWAFTIWDDRKKQLFISRDRLGEKPLYYTVYDNTFIFGSEIKAILAYGIPPRPDLSLSELYLCLGYVPAPFSFFKNISKLKQGHYLLVKENSFTEYPYWDVPPLAEEEMVSDKKKVYENFENILRDAVMIRMRSDVPFGAFLSGGLDSSSVVALMSEISTVPVRTFTIGFRSREFDERKLARDVAVKFNTRHSEFVVEPDRFDDALNRILHHYDEPFGDSSAIPTGYVSKIASREVKMVLTGDGGDEVLSGYNAYQVEKFARQYRNIPSPVKNFLPELIAIFGNAFTGTLRYKLNRAVRVLHYAAQPYQKRLLMKSSWYIPHLIEELTAGLGKQVKLADFINDFYGKYPVNDSFYKLMLFQLKVLLPDDFLVKVDRMSMAYSLETRIPFLDHRLVEYMMMVSKNIKMEGYERKSVLRNTIGKKLPGTILRGPKKGFTVPMHDWFKDRKFDERLNSLYQNDFGLNGKIIKEILSANKKGQADLGNFIWMLFTFKSWMENYGKN
ncbi:MAG: asparagine synthase (glutamine-hydrolyzing) [Bacteroidetes bacterium]|nr:asparagine synthase (glutamine-hydrolyzing) [Bacteroidota bacterium]